MGGSLLSLACGLAAATNHQSPALRPPPHTALPVYHPFIPALLIGRVVVYVASLRGTAAICPFPPPFMLHSYIVPHKGLLAAHRNSPLDQLCSPISGAPSLLQGLEPGGLHTPHRAGLPGRSGSLGAVLPPARVSRPMWACWEGAWQGLNWTLFSSRSILEGQSWKE